MPDIHRIRKLLAIAFALSIIAVVLRLVSFYSFYMPQIHVLHERIERQVVKAGGDYLGIGDIPENFTSALISTEDRRFYSHHGLDSRGLLRAVLTNLKQERFAEGGSTITQQLARGQFLTRRKSFQRKAKELLLALAIEKVYDKDTILEMYVNQSYYGHGAVGLGEAAGIYFRKRASGLTLAESAVLAGILRGPSLYDPYHNPDLAKKRQGAVLRNMVECDKLEVGDASAAYARALPLVGPGRVLMWD